MCSLLLHIIVLLSFLASLCDGTEAVGRAICLERGCASNASLEAPTFFSCVLARFSDVRCFWEDAAS